MIMNHVLKNFILLYTHRSGSNPVMYTEAPNSQQLMLVIPQLMETMAGNYRCVASYANSEILEAEVKVETYGMQSI